jgi:DNA-binding MarR family transcriptional regulator
MPSIEQELNELRTAIAQSASAKDRKALEARLEEIREMVEGSRQEPGGLERTEIMRALSVADSGKPGYLSFAQIQKMRKLTKSQVHGHINALEKAGKVWIRKTHHPEGHPDAGRPAFYVYHPKAVRA